MESGGDTASDARRAHDIKFLCPVPAVKNSAFLRHLGVLDLTEDYFHEEESEVVDWISKFPKCNTPLESLVFVVLQPEARRHLLHAHQLCGICVLMIMFLIWVMKALVGIETCSNLRCWKLESILYFCQRMTNAAVVAMSENCPNLLVFRLCIMGRHRPIGLLGSPWMRVSGRL
ncbi:hypothetical protein ZWY2020_015145 [Hordeum vulgare]|nr:hypothetical protein ZWY2020_015145 [Hordeum vulgare]